MNPKTLEHEERKVVGRGALRRARVQDHDRPVRRQADLLPGLLREDSSRDAHLQREQGDGRAPGPRRRDAREQARGARRGLLRRDRRGGGAEERPHRRHALRPRNTRSCSRRCTSPSRSSRSRSSRRPRSDEEKMANALNKLQDEDPTFRVQDRRGLRPDPDLGDGRAPPRDPGRPDGARVLRGGQHRQAPGGLQGDDHARRSSSARGSRARPAAAASSPTSRSCSSRMPPGGGFVWENEIKGGAIPREYIPSVEKGIIEAMENGIMAGYPMVDVKVSLIDGQYHEVDSSEMAFKIAGSMAFKEAVPKADAAAARADHGRRGGRARGVHGRRHRRPELAPRAHRRHVPALRRARDRGVGAAVGDVRLRDAAALDHAGARGLLDAVLAVRRRCQPRWRRRSSRR